MPQPRFTPTSRAASSAARWCAGTTSWRRAAMRRRHGPASSGSRRSPTSSRTATSCTNDPDVSGTGPFPIAGDPVVVYNPKSGLFDVICQAFGGKRSQKVQLLSTTFDTSLADPADPADSYGLGAWRLPAVPIAAG